jgi:hypothetical protein
MCCHCSIAVVRAISTQNQLLLLLVAPLPIESCRKKITLVTITVVLLLLVVTDAAREFSKKIHVLLLLVATNVTRAFSKVNYTCCCCWLSPMPLVSFRKKNKRAAAAGCHRCRSRFFEKFFFHCRAAAAGCHRCRS